MNSQIFSRFLRNQDGNVAFIFVLALVPILGIIALAVNYSSASGLRSEYQSIADSAVLAGSTAATNDTDATRQQRALNWFNAQIGLKNLPPASVNVVTTDGVLTLTATAQVAPIINSFFTGNMEVKVAASAQIAQAKIRRVLDVAFCIDATGSMQPTIDSVKARANSFSTDLNSALQARGLEQFDYTRIRAVFYRDFAVDDKNKTYWNGFENVAYPVGPMTKSNFFVMPSGSSDLTTFLGSEYAWGGGDEPESSYECIHEGMTSSWFKKGDPIPGLGAKADAIYPVVVLWSDANALPLPHDPSINSGQYPANMPTSEILFAGKWNNGSIIDQENKMLVHFGLCDYPSWALARSLGGYMCGGTLSEGNSNMVNKIADAMVVRYRNLNTRLSR